MQSLNKTIFGITVWHEICVGSNFRGCLIDLRELNPVKTNSLQKKFRKNLLLLFKLPNFNQIDCKQCNQKYGFCLCHFQVPHMKSAKKFFPGVKFEIQIHENLFPRNSKNPKSVKLNSRKSFMPHGFSRCGNCEQVCFSCNMSAFASRFQQSRIWELPKFFRARRSLPPPPPAPQVWKCPYAYVWINKNKACLVHAAGLESIVFNKIQLHVNYYLTSSE